MRTQHMEVKSYFEPSKFKPLERLNRAERKEDKLR